MEESEKKLIIRFGAYLWVGILVSWLVMALASQFGAGFWTQVAVGIVAIHLWPDPEYADDVRAIIRRRR